MLGIRGFGNISSCTVEDFRRFFNEGFNNTRECAVICIHTWPENSVVNQGNQTSTLLVKVIEVL